VSAVLSGFSAGADVVRWDSARYRTEQEQEHEHD